MQACDSRFMVHNLWSITLVVAGSKVSLSQCQSNSIAEALT